MMRAILVCCFVLIAIFGLVCGFPRQEEAPRCYMQNEEYTTCGPACPLTCQSRSQTEPSFCVDMCVPGCFCKSGYVRNRWGNCISAEKCPCSGPNERYVCRSACQTTCDTLNQDCPNENNTQCNQGCHCIDGYVRNSLGICIPINQCH